MHTSGAGGGMVLEGYPPRTRELLGSHLSAIAWACVVDCVPVKMLFFLQFLSCSFNVKSYLHFLNWRRYSTLLKVQLYDPQNTEGPFHCVTLLNGLI